MRLWKFLLPLLATSFCFAAQSNRITAAIDSNQLVALQGNIHGLAQARYDLGRADSGQMVYGVTLAFHPSAAQQADLDNLLAQQRERSSPNYHKWLTPAQFADRFGMSKADIARVSTWLQSQGFTVTRVANSRNQISFDGTIAQVEAAFSTEIHNYAVNGETHFANSTEPSVPAALASAVLAVGHLNNFSPKARAKVRTVAPADPHFTSHVSGDHFLAPGDFETIYDLTPLRTAGNDGTGTSIAVIGQSTVAASDLANFRSAAGLAAKVPQYVLFPSTSTATRCAGDEGESDLDLEWSNGVAPNANVIFVYAGLTTGDTCGNRANSVWDALQDAVDTKIAPVISTSYGFCESGLGLTFANTVRSWAQQANTQGQTIMAASGDDGAADCDNDVTSATQGLAVDVPAAIPEVTGMGGTEFTGDSAGTVSGANAGATQYWSGTTGGTDDINSALSYIPEEAWNDTTLNLSEGGTIGASGGGASIYYTKAAGEADWQTGVGVPNDGKRDVPDLAVNASPDHDGYLFCSEDGQSGIVATCTTGFRDSSGNLAVVGGTSAAAPTFTAILALIEEDIGETTGLANINPTLYQFAANSPLAFHDILTGSNIVPCTSGTTGCPATAPFQYGFSAGAGYDQVTGLGTVDANELATAFQATVTPDFALSPSPTSLTVSAGQSVTTTLTISAVSGSTPMVVNFAPQNCTGLPAGATCSFNPPSVTFDGVNNATTVVTISTTANMTATTSPQTITIKPTNSPATSAQINLTVTKTTETFTIAATNASYTVTAGSTATINLTVSSTTGFINTSSNTTVLPLNYSCTGLPSEATGSFSPGTGTGCAGSTISATTVTLTIATTPATTQLQNPLGHTNRIFYALMLPGIFGIALAAGTRTRAARLLGMIIVLGISSMWLTSCGGSSSNSGSKNPGTPAGTYTITIGANTGTTSSDLTNQNAPYTIQLIVTD